MASFHGIWSLAGFTGAAVGLLMIWQELLPWQHFVIISVITIICSLVFISGAVDAKSDSNKPGLPGPIKKSCSLALLPLAALYAKAPCSTGAAFILAKW